MPSFSIDRVVSGTQGGVAAQGVYLVSIEGNARGYQGGRKIRVLAQTPEEIGIQIDNEWEALVANGAIPLPAFLGAGAIGVGVTGAQQFLQSSGIKLANQGLTSQIWRGTSPLEIQLPLLLNARRSAYDDVVVPMRNLIQLASPFSAGRRGEENTLLNTIIHAPGPTLIDAITRTDANNISVSIGRLITIPSVVIISLQFDIQNRMTRDGWPVEANVNVVLRTHYTYLREDYETFFGFSGDSGL